MVNLLYSVPFSESENFTTIKSMSTAVAESRFVDTALKNSKNITSPYIEKKITSQSSRKFATFDSYTPKVAQSVEPITILTEDSIERQGYIIVTESLGTWTLLMPIETAIFPLPYNAFSELNGALTYLKSKSNSIDEVVINQDHSDGIMLLSNFWIDIWSCFYEDGTQNNDNATVGLSEVSLHGLGTAPTQSDVLNVGPDQRLLNLELKKSRKTNGSQFRRQEAGIRTVLQRENNIDLEPGRIVSLRGVYSGEKPDRIIDFSLPRRSVLFEHFRDAELKRLHAA